MKVFLQRFAILLIILTFKSFGYSADQIQFNRDIRPILSDNCFACHGLDAKKREADLRLDVAGSEAIVPGDVEKSSLWQRIVSTDPDEIMPPPNHGKTLSADEINRVRRLLI